MTALQDNCGTKTTTDGAHSCVPCWLVLYMVASQWQEELSYMMRIYENLYCHIACNLQKKVYRLTLSNFKFNNIPDIIILGASFPWPPKMPGSKWINLHCIYLRSYGLCCNLHCIKAHIPILLATQHFDAIADTHRHTHKHSTHRHRYTPTYGSYI